MGVHFTIGVIPRQENTRVTCTIFIRVPGEPSRISKLNTALQMLFVVFVLSRAAFDWPDKITITVLGASILVTVVISGVDYVWSWSRRAREG